MINHSLDFRSIPDMGEIRLEEKTLAELKQKWKWKEKWNLHVFALIVFLTNYMINY